MRMSKHPSCLIHRNLLVGISYSDATPGQSFAYDHLGNRKPTACEWVPPPPHHREKKMLSDAAHPQSERQRDGEQLPALHVPWLPANSRHRCRQRSLSDGSCSGTRRSLRLHAPLAIRKDGTWYGYGWDLRSLGPGSWITGKVI